MDQENASSKKVDNIRTSKLKQLQDEIDKQTNLIFKLKETIIKKDDEIKHLKDLLSSAVPILDEAHKFKISDEEEIALKQLEILKRNAQERQLTLDEIKMFDLLVKNKRLSQGKPTENAKFVKLPNDSDNLIAIASRPLSTEIKKPEDEG